MKIFITGGCGFLGSNLARAALTKGYELTVFDNLFKAGSELNLSWLKSLGKFNYVHGDIRNTEDVERAIAGHRPEVVFHVAGQVAMLTSLEAPRLDFEINTLGTINLLEAIKKHAPKAICCYSSTNKVYGDLEWLQYKETETRWTTPSHENGFKEDLPLDFRSPYGCSKGAAEQYLLDYHRMFNLNTVVFRHSSMYGPRQYATFGQGWIGWFCEQAVAKKRNPNIEPFTISGDGKQVRDVLHADDMVDLYFSSVEKIDQAKGQVFNIGGGMQNSLSLLELFSFLEKELGIDLEYRRLKPRKSDQKVFVADVGKARSLLGWTPKMGKEEGLKDMIEWISDAVK
jgi:CDP-paratose 2-epimerase